MATQSSSSPNPPNPASEAMEPKVNDQQDAKSEVPMDKSTPSIFVNSEPMREDQVQNAVKFLSHPKVKGSPVMYRRSFLERKGLTKEEIDEAFRRVPDSAPTVGTTQPGATSQGGQMQPSSVIQQQAPTQPLQPAAAAPAAIVPKMGTLTTSRFHWSQALLAVGVLAISGAGTAIVFKNAVIPRLKSWIRKVVLEEEEGIPKKANSKPSLAEEAASAAKAAAAAAADVARASQEMLISKSEEKKYFGELMSLLDVQVREMKSMSNSIRMLEGQSKIVGQEDRVPVTISRPAYANGTTDYDSRSARSLSPPPPVEPSSAPPHPKSFMEVMAMVQRGERPPNIRDINDQPPNPDQPVSNPRLAPRTKPWESSQPQISSTVTQENINGVNYVQSNGPAYQANGDSSLPWWQRRNVRITELESDMENKGATGSSSSSEQPVQRSWVPPQPPPVVMPEAAAAIRQPKKTPFQNEQLTDDQFLSRSAELTDELQRITKISESGGVSESNGSSMVNTSEIQTEEDNSYIEA